ncbi:substrate-binding domain-containing protein, partial [Arthrospira platensis SPKY1]|nr:substrate-binding domain-containing protein [Arthrospira platensis SPKY1]
RFSGFSDRILQEGNTQLVWEAQGDFTHPTGVDAATAFAQLPQSERPEAVFVTNDEMLMGFTQQAQALGLKIPHDVATVGYDNIPACTKFYPTLSSVRTDNYELGKQTLNQLRTLQEHPYDQPGK